MAELTDLVASARTGDEAAFARLVDGHAGLVWSVVRGFRLGDASSEDVFQTVWLRLAEHLDDIRDPERMASWLATTARHECVGVIRQRSRTTPSDDVGEDDPADSPVPPDDGMLRDERAAAVRGGLARLSLRCRELLGLLVADPPLSYAEISEVLELPVGSIGPTRARCLERLRATPEIARISGADPASGETP